METLPGGGFHGSEQVETLPGGGFHGSEQVETLPGGGFHGGEQYQTLPRGGFHENESQEENTDNEGKGTSPTRVADFESEQLPTGCWI